MNAAALRQDMADRIAELRTIPADPVERARLLAERITAITGCQCGEVTCWMCGTVRPVADARSAGAHFACNPGYEDDCNEKAAGLDPESEEAEAIYGGAA